MTGSSGVFHFPSLGPALQSVTVHSKLMVLMLSVLSPQTSRLPNSQELGGLVPHVVLDNRLPLHVVAGSLLEVVAKCDASDLNEEKLRLMSWYFIIRSERHSFENNV